MSDRPIGTQGDRKYWEHSVYQFMFAAEEEANKLIKEYSTIILGEDSNNSDVSTIISLPENFKANREMTEENDVIYHKLFAATEAIQITNYIRHN